MAKMVDVVTFSRSITSSTQNQVRQELKNYLDDGYVLFATHYAGIVSPELMMVYVLVKYEDEVAPAPQAESFDVSAETPVVVKKRGRPAKVIETEPVEA